MKNTKKKSIFARFATAMLAAMTMVIVLSFSAVSASAAEVPNTGSSMNIVQTVQISNADNFFDAGSRKATIRSTPAHLVPMVATTPAGTGTTSSADSTYKTVINFLIVWLRRVGVAVALVGAIMFGFAIKNNDADAKQNGLLTLVAGFVVAAICQAADMFDLFT